MADMEDPEDLAGLIGQLCEVAGDYSRSRRKERPAAAENWRQVFDTILMSRVPTARRPEVLALFRESTCGGADREHVLELTPPAPAIATSMGVVPVPPRALEAAMGLSSTSYAGAGPATPGESALGYFSRTAPAEAAARPVSVPRRSLGALLRIGILAGLGVPASLCEAPTGPRVPSGPWAGLGRAEALGAFRRDYARHARAMAGSAAWPARRHELLSAWVSTVDALAGAQA